MVWWSSYRWYIEPPTHGISNTLPVVFRTLYPWYIEPPTHGVVNSWYVVPLSMVFRSPYPWYIESPTHDILTPYPWYIEPPTHGILNPLLIVYWTPYSWYFEPPIHDISNYGILSPYLLTIETPAYLIIRNEGVQNTIGVQFTIQRQFSKRVLSISWMKFDPYIMGFKVSYDTGVKISPKMMECHW